MAVLTKNEAEEALALIGREVFYVYLLYRPDGTPFYVGKGRGRRIFHHEREALGLGRTHKLNTIRAVTRAGAAIGYQIHQVFECEAECLEHEIELIRTYGRHDLGTGPLTYLTDGGEGTVGLSEETLRRIDAALHGPDAPGERGIANRFFLRLCEEVSSVPVRPLATTLVAHSAPHRVCRKPSKRMAAALAASAIANRVLIEPGAVIPRKLFVEDAPMVIENGVASDLLRAGLAQLIGAANPRDESFLLSGVGYEAVLRFLEQGTLLGAGVLLPHL
ncbi:MAG: GIY-YIG nuclease family protein [Lysobacteraceae bacterium]